MALPPSAGGDDRFAHHSCVIGELEMTLDRQKQLLREIVAEYDLETALNALVEIYSSDEIMAYLIKESITSA